MNNMNNQSNWKLFQIISIISSSIQIIVFVVYFRKIIKVESIMEKICCVKEKWLNSILFYACCVISMGKVIYETAVWYHWIIEKSFYAD